VVEPRSSDERHSVWVALSELFVGRQLLDADYEHVAATLATSGYSIDELEQILRDEVSPALRSNVGLLGIPEILGWSPDEIRAMILAHRKRESFVTRWIRWRPPRVVRERWRVLRVILQERLRAPVLSKSDTDIG
jgi:hypothetical protein